MEKQSHLATADEIIVHKSKFLTYKNLIFSFQPIVLDILDFSPLTNIKVSLPCLALSLVSVRYYRIKYMLVNSKVLRIFSFGLNYAILCYLANNGIKFYEHYNKFDFSQ